MKISELAAEAEKIVGIPGWVAWDFRAIENGVLCKGAVCPLITKGPNQGKPNYRKYDKKTLKQVIVTRKSVAQNGN